MIEVNCQVEFRALNHSPFDGIGRARRNFVVVGQRCRQGCGAEGLSSAVGCLVFGVNDPLLKGARCDAIRGVGFVGDRFVRARSELRDRKSHSRRYGRRCRLPSPSVSVAVLVAWTEFVLGQWRERGRGGFDAEGVRWRNYQRTGRPGRFPPITHQPDLGNKTGWHADVPAAKGLPFAPAVDLERRFLTTKRFDKCPLSRNKSDAFLSPDRLAYTSYSIRWCTRYSVGEGSRVGHDTGAVACGWETGLEKCRNGTSVRGAGRHAQCSLRPRRSHIAGLHGHSSATGMRLTDARTVRVPVDGRLRFKAGKTEKWAYFEVAQSPVLTGLIARRDERDPASVMLLTSDKGRQVSQTMLRDRWDAARIKAARANPKLAADIRLMYLRDMRKRAADLAEDLEAATKLLQHTSPKLTANHYRTRATKLTAASLMRQRSKNCE